MVRDEWLRLQLVVAQVSVQTVYQGTRYMPEIIKLSVFCDFLQVHIHVCTGRPTANYVNNACQSVQGKSV